MSARRWSVIFLFMGMILYFFANFQRVSVPGTIFNQLQSELDCSAAAITSVGSVFMYTYALIQLLVGLLVDKYGGARVMTFGSVLFCLGGLLFPFSDGLPMLYASRFLVGLGAGSVYLSVLKEADRLFPENFAMWNGIALLIGYSGGIVATLPLACAVEAWGWRAPMLLAGGLGCGAFAFVCYGYWRSAKSAIAPEPLGLAPIFGIFRNPRSYLVFGSSGVLFAIYYTILTCVGKKFLEDFGGLSVREAAGCVFTMVVVSSLMNFGGGVLTRWCGNCRKIFLLTAVGSSFAATLMMVLGVWGKAGGFYFTAAFLLYAVSSGFLPISNSIIREVNNPKMTGAAVSMLNFVSYLLVALLGNLAGLLLDCFRGEAVQTAGAMIYPASAYMTIFMLLLVLAAGGIVAAARIPETFGKNCWEKR